MGSCSPTSRRARERRRAARARSKRRARGAVRWSSRPASGAVSARSIARRSSGKKRRSVSLSPCGPVPTGAGSLHFTSAGQPGPPAGPRAATPRKANHQAMTTPQPIESVFSRAWELLTRNWIIIVPGIVIGAILGVLRVLLTPAPIVYTDAAGTTVYNAGALGATFLSAGLLTLV